jgi:hypothetical protein
LALGAPGRMRIEPVTTGDRPDIGRARRSAAT